MRTMRFSPIPVAALAALACACASPAHPAQFGADVVPSHNARTATPNCNAATTGSNTHGIYVVDYSDNRVIILDICANGVASPIGWIRGGDTGLFGPTGIGLDSLDDIYVANQLGNSITEYAPGATGDAAPIATLAGPHTHLAAPLRLEEHTRRTYITQHDRVLVFGRGAHGDVPPIWEIAGSNTGLTDAQDIATDAFGRMYVTNLTSNSVLVFGPTAKGNVAPQFVYAGSQTGLNGPTGVTLDKSGNVYVANRNGGDVLIFGPPGENGNAPPIGSFVTDAPRDLCIDRLGAVYVLDVLDRTISVYTGSGTNWTRTRKITGIAGGAWSPDEFTVH